MEIRKTPADREVFDGFETAHIIADGVTWSVSYFRGNEKRSGNSFVLNRDGKWFAEAEATHIDIAIHIAKAIIEARASAPKVWEFED